MTGQMFGNDAFQQPYSNIAGVQVRFNIMTGYFEMSAGGMQNSSKSYWSGNKNIDPAQSPNCISLNLKSQAKKFQEASAFIMNKINEVRSGYLNTSSSSIVDPKDNVLESIEKLGQLKINGIITDEEFQTKKADLLSRL